MNTSPKVVIIHGTGGCPSANWFPWLEQELASLGYQAITPTFPTLEGQSLENWKKAFREQVGSLDSNSVLVGHSIGAGFALNLVEDSSVPIIGTYLVAGFTGKIGLPEYDVLNQSLVCRDFNWQKIRSNLGHGCIFHSDNDPYVALSKAEELSKKLDIKITLIPGAGHFNQASGYTKFPLLLEKLKSGLPSRV